MERVNLRKLLYTPLRGQNNGPIAGAQPSLSTLLGSNEPSAISGNRDLSDHSRVSSFASQLQALLTDV